MIIIAILFLANFLRAFTGFGDAVIAMPLLMLCLPGQVAIPLVALTGGTIGIIMMIRGYKDIDFKATWRLVLASFVGVPIGIYYLKTFDDQLIKIFLGGTLLLLTASSFLRPGVLRLRTDKSSYLFGFLSGALGGAYNTNGPPIVVYGTLRGWEQKDFHTTLQGYFFLNGFSILLGHGASGLWTKEVFILYGASLPAVVLALVCGGKIARNVSGRLFHQIINVFVGVIGVILLWQNI
ncbi:MAG: hypothetical protein A2X86_01740 [Bdellovibrionales bacterium GWA2_49_15]|nr:MAG: hypothetical protein A2X86_01740 [Bdellovibrionales bacterium GWA2_49_15]